MMRRCGAAVLLLASCTSEPADEGLDGEDPTGALVVRYESPVEDLWMTAEEVVMEDDVTIERRIRRGRGGRLVFRRVDGHRVKVAVRSAAGEGAEVSVRVDPASRDLARMIQDRIGEKLSLKKARVEFFGERSVGVTSDADLRRCMAAAERACRALGMEVVYRRLDETGGRLDALDASGRVVKITLRPAGGETGAILSTEASEDLLGSVRREFERQLVPAAE